MCPPRVPHQHLGGTRREQKSICSLLRFLHTLAISWYGEKNICYMNYIRFLESWITRFVWYVWEWGMKFSGTYTAFLRRVSWLVYRRNSHVRENRVWDLADRVVALWPLQFTVTNAEKLHWHNNVRLRMLKVYITEGRDITCLTRANQFLSKFLGNKQKSRREGFWGFHVKFGR